MLPRVTGIQDKIAHGSILDLNLDQAGVGRDVAPSSGSAFSFYFGQISHNFFPTDARSTVSAFAKSGKPKRQDAVAVGATWVIRQIS
jgi:hypothetical protein